MTNILTKTTTQSSAPIAMRNRRMRRLLLSIHALALGAVLFVSPQESHALVLGGSNLSLSMYPDPDCSKPTKPIKPYSLNSQWQVDSYNRDVDLYNSAYEDYVRCVKEYLKNASNDIDRINEKMKEAVDTARRSY